MDTRTVSFIFETDEVVGRVERIYYSGLSAELSQELDGYRVVLEIRHGMSYTSTVINQSDLKETISVLEKALEFTRERKNEYD